MDIDEHDEERLREVGRYLTQLREKHGLTQKQAADAAGMASTGYLSLLEGGKRPISIKTLEKLAEAYSHVTIGEMMDHIGFTKKGKLAPFSPLSFQKWEKPYFQSDTETEKVTNLLQAEQVTTATTPRLTASDRAEASTTPARLTSIDAALASPASGQLPLIDAALQFIGHDPNFQMPPFAPETPREKAMLVALYQQNSGRKLLTDEELRTLSAQA